MPTLPVVAFSLGLECFCEVLCMTFPAPRPPRQLAAERRAREAVELVLGCPQRGLPGVHCDAAVFASPPRPVQAPELSFLPCFAVLFCVRGLTL